MADNPTSGNTYGQAAAEGTGAAVSLGFSAYGAYEQVEASKKENAAQIAQIGLEEQQNTLRQQMMQLTSHRQSLQNLRQAQAARALAVTDATNQGAQFGSGLQSGLGQVSGQEASNALGLSQNLQLGNQMFSLTNQIDQQKIAYAQAQQQSQQAAGISSFGKSLGSSIGPLANLAMQVGPLLAA